MRKCILLGLMLFVVITAMQQQSSTSGLLTQSGQILTESEKLSQEVDEDLLLLDGINELLGLEPSPRSPQPTAEDFERWLHTEPAPDLPTVITASSHFAVRLSFFVQ